MPVREIQPTRSELLEITKKLKLTKNGHKILKLKRDGLILEFFKILDQSKDLRREIAARYKEAQEKIAIANAVEPAAYWGAFAISKSGLGTLAAIWADECEQAGRPRFHVVVPGPVATPQRIQSHPGENRAALPLPETVAMAYLRLLGPEGRALGSAPLTVV